MPASVTRLRPREFYAVVPGPGGGPGEDGPVPVFYARTLNGSESALVHARLLSAGGGIQYITLTEGRRTWIWRTFQGGREVASPDPPVVYQTVLRPPAGDLRPGAPRGHIPEACTTAKNRKAGRTPRHNANCPPCEWPGLTAITSRETQR